MVAEGLNLARIGHENICEFTYILRCFVLFRVYVCLSACVTGRGGGCFRQLKSNCLYSESRRAGRKGGKNDAKLKNVWNRRLLGSKSMPVLWWVALPGEGLF